MEQKQGSTKNEEAAHATEQSKIGQVVHKSISEKELEQSSPSGKSDIDPK